MASVLTVSQLNKYVSFKLSSDIKLKGVAVKGEISNFVCHFKSGHLYFTLKDSQSQIRAVMFSSNASRLKFEPEDGMSVLAVGNAELYERDGTFQIVVSDLVPMGAGDVNDGIEKLKKKLLDNGIIDEKDKKPIPLVPKKLAIVTSKDAAALRDILTITQRRYPVCEIEIYPALVQGAFAADSIAKALKRADNSGADTIILARGGGSAEDLMAFNSESVAMAVHDCNTPVVTAVGHETDTTIVDYVSDMRAPTPSAAAEICTPDKSEIISALTLVEKRLNTAYERILDKKLALLQAKVTELKALSPERRLERLENDIDSRKSRLSYLMQSKLKVAESRLMKDHALLTALSPFSVLERGYSITTKNGRVILDKDDIAVGDSIEIRLSNTGITAEITNITDIKDQNYEL